MYKKKVKLNNGETIYHGDYIKATLVCCDEDCEIVGRFCITEQGSGYSDNYYICQDDCNGDDSAHDKFEYRYSWNVKITEDGRVISSDTLSLELLKKEDTFDNDVMPEDWVMDEIIPNDL